MDHDLSTVTAPAPTDPVWQDAHTDYSPGHPPRPAPRGLAADDTEWSTYLQQHTPNGWLMRAGSLLETLASGRPIYLMHTTANLNAIRASGQLYQAPGCMVGALYCVLLTPGPAGLRPHNLGAWLLANKAHRDILIIEVTPGGPVPAKGIDYLRLGAVHLASYVDHRAFLTPAEDDHLRAAAVQRIRQAATVLDMLVRNACGAATPADRFLDQVAGAVPLVPFLGYLYFEAVSEYLMLHSTSRQTRACAEVGEMNTLLSKDLAFAAVDTMGELFDLALFQPGHARLRELIGQVEPGLVDGAAEYVRRRLAHLFACVALDPSQDATAVTFAQATFDTLAWAAPGLLGQMVFRLLRTSPRYPQLYPVFEQPKATGASAFWTAHGIPAPFNGVIPKGEIGLNMAWPAGARIWTADVNEGVLHPAEELPLTLVPRLSDLRDTALGRARFTLPDSEQQRKH
ncbi:hypothetical protein ACIA8R_43820 [Nonomuraea sp. NPDC051191]|uniref:hypothetical protein n=1 Tax=Nonomuraea sp. NPDC051191 TaxID=3364372 RepID=UPI0037ACBE36